MSRIAAPISEASENGGEGTAGAILAAFAVLALVIGVIGFTLALVPQANVPKVQPDGITVTGVRRVDQLLETAF